MLVLSVNDPHAVAVTAAIQRGDIGALAQQLASHPEFARARVTDAHGTTRALLHVVADWPGHVPNGAQLVALLVRAGADVNARVTHAGPHGSPETALHWAASSDDVAVLDALLDHGADIEATGAVFTNGTPMSDAVVFAQWRAARRLLERGAATTLWQAAALGVVERVRACCAQADAPTSAQLANGLWHACRGGQLEVAELLVDRGADPNWLGHDHKTALDAARESDAPALVAWLLTRGATSARDRQW